MKIFFKIALLLILCTKVLAGEFRIINTETLPKIGMFATANQVLGQLYIYEKGDPGLFAGLVVDLGVSGLYYDPEHGPNWWNYYFDPICVGTIGTSTIKYPSKKEYLDVFAIRKQMTRVQAAAIVKKYIHVRSSLLEKVDAFAAHHFQGFFTIGVHYRGTDKEKEAPRVSYGLVVKKIRAAIPLNQPYRIFVATDEAPFLEMIKERFPHQVVAAEAHRSSGTVGVHFSNNNRYEVGEEALIDCLLLSKCNLLIRTSSNLSLWSTYFNPEIPVVLLNRRNKPTLEPE